jgi:hypothetical protein
MLIAGKILDLDCEGSIATVVVRTPDRVRYLHCESRLLALALEDAYPDGDVIGQRIACETEGIMLLSFEPDADYEGMP